MFPGGSGDFRGFMEWSIRFQRNSKSFLDTGVLQVLTDRLQRTSRTFRRICLEGLQDVSVDLREFLRVSKGFRGCL